MYLYLKFKSLYGHLVIHIHLKNLHLENQFRAELQTEWKKFTSRILYLPRIRPVSVTNEIYLVPNQKGNSQHDPNPLNLKGNSQVKLPQCSMH